MRVNGFAFLVFFMKVKELFLAHCYHHWSLLMPGTADGVLLQVPLRRRGPQQEGREAQEGGWGQEWGGHAGEGNQNTLHQGKKRQKRPSRRWWGGWGVPPAINISGRWALGGGGGGVKRGVNNFIWSNF